MHREATRREWRGPDAETYEVELHEPIDERGMGVPLEVDLRTLPHDSPGCYFLSLYKDGQLLHSTGYDGPARDAGDLTEADCSVAFAGYFS